MLKTTVVDWKYKLSGANLTGTMLIGAILKDAKLGDANLSGADLTRVNLRQANLSGARLSKTILDGANLSGALLIMVDLSRAKNVTFEQLKSVKSLYGTIGIDNKERLRLNEEKPELFTKP